MMDTSQAGPPTTGSKRARNNFSSFDARGDRSRANSFEFANDEGGDDDFIKPKSTKLLSKDRNHDKRKKQVDHVELVLLVDKPGNEYTNRCKSMIAKEVQRIAPGVILTGIFFLPRGGIKLVCGDEDMKDRIMKSSSWGKDAFGSSASLCHPPRVAGWEPPVKSNVVWSDEMRSYVDCCKVVVDSIPSEYEDKFVLEELGPIGVTEVKTFKLPPGWKGDAQRLVVFSDADKAAAALAKRFSFVLYGCAYPGRYLRVSKPPVQCSRCQKFGHPTTVCVEVIEKCRRCGEEGHPEGDPRCKVEKPEDVRCANCRENHKANAYVCKVYKDAKARTIASASKSAKRRPGVSYTQAASAVATNNRADSNAPCPVAPQATDAKTEKLLCALLALFVATRNEKDNSKVIMTAVTIITGTAPEFLENKEVRKCLGLANLGKDPGRQASQWAEKASVDNKAPSC